VEEDWEEDFDWDGYNQLPSESESSISRYILAIKTAGSRDEPKVFVVYTWDDDCIFRYGEVLSAIYL
jgi:hypothetical protein